MIPTQKSKSEIEAWIEAWTLTRGYPGETEFSYRLSPPQRNYLSWTSTTVGDTTEWRVGSLRCHHEIGIEIARYEDGTSLGSPVRYHGGVYSTMAADMYT
jgi:hypothetical protein